MTISSHWLKSSYAKLKTKKPQATTLAFLKRVLLFACAAIMTAAPVYATNIPSDEVLDRFDSNGIYYYNPNGDYDACKTSATTLAGNDVPQKMWNYFIGKGFSDAQAAGILGNAYAESSYSVTRSSNGSYWGIFQWGGGRRDAVQAKVREAGLSQYLDAKYWPASAVNSIPEADRDKLLQVELDFAFSEGGWKSEIKKADSPELAAEIYLTLFERAVNGSEPIRYYEPYKGRLYQDTNKRVNAAVKAHQEYSGKGVSTTLGTDNVSETGKSVTIIGDSITEGSKAAIKKKFKNISDADIDSRVGRPWSEGVDILRAKQGSVKKTLIFALGTNSARLTKANIEEVIHLAGPGRNVVFVTNYAKGGKAYDSNNALFKDYAKNNSNVSVADWASAVGADPAKYLAADQTHPNSAGQQLFAETLAKALNGNLTVDGCSVNGEFESLVKAYAWPEWHDAPWHTRQEAYAQAVDRSISEGRYVGGSVAGIPGIDCGGFVTILLQNSGLAPNYNDTKGNTVTQEAWVKNHGWTLLNASPTTAVDTSILQAGDVAFSSGHTFIYVGEIEGFNSRIASASYEIDGAGRAPMAGLEDLIFGNGVTVRWYRNPNYNANENTDSLTNTVYSENAQE